MLQAMFRWIDQPTGSCRPRGSVLAAEEVMQPRGVVAACASDRAGPVQVSLPARDVESPS